MNFKIFSLFFIGFFLNSCGVKSKPTAPAGTSLPSYIGSFYKKEFQAIKSEKKKSPIPKKKEL